MNSTKESTSEKSVLNANSFSSLYAYPGKSSVPASELNVPVSLGPTGKAKQHFYLYCNTMQLQIARHLERKHPNESLVKNFTRFDVRSEKRREAITIIRKKGDFMHNTSTTLNKGHVIAVRRCQVGKKKTAAQLVNCSRCTGFYAINNLRHHYANCTKSNSGRTRSVLQNAAQKLSQVHQVASHKMRHVILPVLRQNDEITEVVKYDRLIILYGNLLSVKHKLPHQEAMIRGFLRLLGRLVLALREITKKHQSDHKISELADAFHPKHFNDVLKGVNTVARFDEETQKYASPSTASALGTAIRKCSEILKCKYIIDQCPYSPAKNHCKAWKFSNRTGKMQELTENILIFSLCPAKKERDSNGWKLAN